MLRVESRSGENFWTVVKNWISRNKGLIFGALALAIIAYCYYLFWPAIAVAAVTTHGALIAIAKEILMALVDFIKDVFPQIATSLRGIFQALGIRNSIPGI